MTNITENLFDFVEKSPTQFQCVSILKEDLDRRGFRQLMESRKWDIKAGGKYYVVKCDSAIIAFEVPEAKPYGFMIVATHDDSPMLKIKENPEIEAENHYIRLNVEKYGGALLNPWFDRPLSLAGRVIVRTKNGIKSVPVNEKEPMMIIPSLAIHMNREANDGAKISVQKDMLPVYSDETGKDSFIEKVAQLADVDAKDILSYDLYVYNAQAGSEWGPKKEFISAPRLDDLECVFASHRGFVESGSSQSIKVNCVFDNEEVGSTSKQGADSTFLEDTLERISDCLGNNKEEYRMLLTNSFMISADNAHAVHPAYGNKACPVNRPAMNDGVVIKYSGNQKYTTDGISAAVVKSMCEKNQIKYQIFTNNSDVAGGSTLGGISSSKVSVNSADIGLAMLAMHSPFETAGAFDLESMIQLLKYYFESSLREGEDCSISIEHS